MKDNSNDNNEQNREFDLWSTFEFPVLSELDKTGMKKEAKCFHSLMYKYNFIRIRNR